MGRRGGWGTILRTEARIPPHIRLLCQFHCGIAVRTCPESHAMKATLRLWLFINRHLCPVVMPWLLLVIGYVQNYETMISKVANTTKKTL